MAGTLLFIAREGSDKKLFSEKIDLLKRHTKKFFAEYFYRIEFLQPEENSFLIEFRKDDEQKIFRDKTGNWLTYEGVVFALNETRSYNPEELLEIYRHKGSDFVNELDGHFVIKVFDAEKNSYLVFTDFIKNKTNYLAQNENFLMFTPFAITSSVIIDPQLDQAAFNEFMWRYYTLSNRTLLQNVTCLQPARIYSFARNILAEEIFWKWPRGYSNLSFPGSVHKMVESMQESAHLIDEVFPKSCLDFTMGQDTRQIVSAFRNQDLEFATSIFGKPGFYEVEQVGKMAEKFNIEHHNITLQKDFSENISDHFHRAVILGSCSEPGHQLGRIMYMREQQSQFGKAVLNGADGHFYKNGLWDEMYTFNLYREPKAFNIDSFLNLRALSNNYSDDIFTADFLTNIKAESKKYFRQLIENSISDHLQSPVSIQVDKFDLYHWLNFGIASNNAGNLLTNSISILLLRRNLEFALQIPVRWKFNLSEFQRAVVYRLSPELAREKTDFGGVNMLPKNILTYFPFYLRYFYFQSSRLRNKIKSKMGLKVVTHLQEAWDYLPLYRKLFDDLKAELDPVYSNLHLQEIIKEDEWDEFLQEFDNENKDLGDYEYFFKLISVELFLQKAKEFSRK